MDPLIKSDQEESYRAGQADTFKKAYGSINENVLVDEDIKEEKIKWVAFKDKPFNCLLYVIN